MDRPKRTRNAPERLGAAEGVPKRPKEAARPAAPGRPRSCSEVWGTEVPNVDASDLPVIQDRILAALRGACADAGWLEGLALVEFAPGEPAVKVAKPAPDRRGMQRSAASRAVWTWGARKAAGGQAVRLVVDTMTDAGGVYERGDESTAWAPVAATTEDDAANGLYVGWTTHVDVKLTVGTKGKHAFGVTASSGDAFSLELVGGDRTARAAVHKVHKVFGTALGLEHFAACALSLGCMDLHGDVLAACQSAGNGALAEAARALYWDGETCRVAADAYVPYPVAMTAGPTD